MPARNRVTPYGDIEALPWRGAWTGNRGILHEGHEIVRFHGHDAWITCVLRLGDHIDADDLPERNGCWSASGSASTGSTPAPRPRRSRRRASRLATWLATRATSASSGGGSG